MLDQIRSYFKQLALVLRDDAQNLTEYALTVTMLALATVAGMDALASGINQTFTTIATTLSTHLH